MKRLMAGGLLFGGMKAFGSLCLAADDGFHLNGRRVQLKGVDLHSDLGLLGKAAAVVRRTGPGALKLTVTSPGLRPATAALPTVCPSSGEKEK